MGIMSAIRSAIVNALRAVLECGKFITKVVYEGGKMVTRTTWEAGRWVAGKAADAAEAAVNFPISLAQGINSALRHANDKGGAGQRTQQALQQQQAALAQQQAQQPQMTAAQVLDRRVTASRRYAADLVQNRECPPDCIDAVGKEMRDYIDMMSRDERIAFMRADVGSVRAMVSGPLFNVVDGIEPFVQKLSAAGRPMPGRRQAEPEQLQHAPSQSVTPEKLTLSKSDERLAREFLVLRQRVRQQQQVQATAGTAMSMA